MRHILWLVLLPWFLQPIPKESIQFLPYTILWSPAKPPLIKELLILKLTNKLIQFKSKSVSCKCECFLRLRSVVKKAGRSRVGRGFNFHLKEVIATELRNSTGLVSHELYESSYMSLCETWDFRIVIITNLCLCVF